jgi:hypothetical protein
MPDYTEEIYERSEKKFVSNSAKLAWLSSFERPARGATSYTKAALKVRNDLVASEELLFKLRNSNDLDEVENIKEDADNLEFYGGGLADAARIKFERLQREEIERQEAELAREISEREELKERIKEAEKLEDVKEARRELRELSPKSYGGIRSGETRKALASFRKIF